MSLEGWSRRRLNIRVHRAEKLTLEEIRWFVRASEGIRLESEDRWQGYSWVERVVVEQEYGWQGKVAWGLLRRCIEKVTGVSRAQVTRLIARYAAAGRVEAAFSGALHGAVIGTLKSLESAFAKSRVRPSGGILIREDGGYCDRRILWRYRSCITTARASRRSPSSWTSTARRCGST